MDDDEKTSWVARAIDSIGVIIGFGVFGVMAGMVGGCVIGLSGGRPDWATLFVTDLNCAEALKAAHYHSDTGGGGFGNNKLTHTGGVVFVKTSFQNEWHTDRLRSARIIAICGNRFVPFEIRSAQTGELFGSYSRLFGDTKQPNTELALLDLQLGYLDAA